MSDEVRKGKFAFTVVQDERGFFQVIDANEQVEVERPTTVGDIKNACREVHEAIVRNETVQMAIAVLAPKQPESEVVEAPEAETSAPEAQ
jgi:hypothetical protein